MESEEAYYMEFEEAFYIACAIAREQGEFFDTWGPSYSESTASEEEGVFRLRDGAGRLVKEIDLLTLEERIQRFERESRSIKDFDPGLARSRETLSEESLMDLNRAFARRQKAKSRRQKSEYRKQTILIAYKKRQRDTGWGYAFASGILPFVFLYYAISRRTITPLLFNTISIIVFAFIFAFIALSAKFAAPFLIPLLGSIAIPLFFCIAIYSYKLGIDQARKYGKMLLRKLSSEEQINKNVDDLCDDEFVPITIQVSDFLGGIAIFLGEIPKRLRKKDESEIIEEKLKNLDVIYKKGLISEEEYRLMRQKKLGL